MLCISGFLGLGFRVKDLGIRVSVGDHRAVSYW